MRGLQAATVPYFPTAGNHDYPEEGYEHYLGPSYYAFNFSNYHFIGFYQHLRYRSIKARSKYTVEQMSTWLERNLEHVKPGQRVVLFQHYPVEQWVLDILADYDVAMVLSGHAHSRQIVYLDDVLQINSMPLRSGGDDSSPPGFRMLHINEGGEIAIRTHIAAVREYARIFTPAEGASYPGEPVRIAAQIQDVSGDPERVEYRINGGSWKTMTPLDNRWTWEAEWVPGPGETGGHQVEVRAAWSGNARATDRISFSVHPAVTLPVVEVDKDWPSFQYDAARTGVAPFTFDGTVHAFAGGGSE